MTRFPTVNRQVEGVEKEPYDIGGICCAPLFLTPYCDNRAGMVERHHLFSRGIMGGAYDWVKLQDGTVVGNIIGLCHVHHRMITENKAQIVYQDGSFYWLSNDGALAPLTTQPPGAWTEIPPVEDWSVVQDKPVREKCPTCKRVMPKPKDESKQEDKKPRKTWAVAVPLTERENGADVLDALLDACVDKMDEYGLSWGDGDRVNYYKLSAVLAFFAQHADSILSDD